jgi:serine/threonine protein kinase
MSEMTPERWQRVKKIFADALAVGPSLREAFLSEACGDDQTLRSDVEKLIRSHEEAGSFVESPPYEATAELVAEIDSDAWLSGRQMGRYSILSKLGGGGMAEVYLAHDNRLDRNVALKLLPRELMSDARARNRLVREAKAAGRLDHPNICSIYEVDEAEGICFIVMQYLEGETLAQRIRRKPLTLAGSTDVAVQIASALVEAHTHGIVHRDIKPANIMMMPGGQVKVMDFGLAKTVKDHPKLQNDESTESLLTPPGTIVGTVAYMSPEQVRGEDLDGRSDIFSFGVVLYELVTGQQPFRAPSVGEVFSAILTEDPAPLARYSRDAPAELERIVDKSLRKDREERYQSVKDMLLDLKRIQERVDLEAKRIGAMPAGFKRETSTGSKSLVSPKLVASAIGVALPTFGLLYLLIGMKHATPRLATFVPGRKITKLTSSGRASTARISADGKYVAYVVSDQGQQSIWLRQVATSSNVQVVAPDDVDYTGLTFSPDGNYVYYSVKKKGGTSYSLYQVASLGGSPRKVLDQVIGSISFSPDGKSFTFVRNETSHNKSMLRVAKSDGTGEQEMAQREIPNQFLQPSWSPDGKVIACSAMSFTGGVHMEITTVAAAGGPEKIIPTGPWAEINGLQWLSDSAALVISGAEPGGPERSQIWQASYPSGRVQPVTNDLNNYTGISITGDSSSVATLEYTTVSNIWTVPISAGGSPHQITSGSGKYSEVACAPDGRIVYCSDVGGGGEDIWVMDVNGKNQKQLTSDAGENAFPAVAQDMRYIVFTSGRVPGCYNTWRADIDGSNSKQLTTGQGDYFPALSPDGKWLYYTVATANATPRIWRCPAEGGPGALLIDHFTFISQVSPDGKLLACGYNDTQDATALNLSLKLGIFSAEGGPPIQTIPMPKGTMGHAETGQFRWSRDGKSLFYIQREAGASNLWNKALSGGPPKQLTRFSSDQIFDFDITADGKQFVCSRGTVVTDVILIKDKGNP